MTLLILLRVALSVIGSAVQKKSLLNGAGVAASWVVVYAMMAIPSIALGIVANAHWSPALIRALALAGSLDALGNVAMLAALRGTDLSIFGPLNALRPLLALFAGWIWLGEIPTPYGFLGIGVTVAGTLLLMKRDEPRDAHADPGDPMKAHPARPSHLRSAIWRVFGLALSAIGAVYLKRAAVVAPPHAVLAGWVFFGLITLLAIGAVIRQPTSTELGRVFQNHRSGLFAQAAILFVMQWVTISIFKSTPLAYAFVFFQLAMLAQVVVGRLWFREPDFKRRLLAGAVMVMGSCLILWRG